jgi:putative ABC transport system permease protein
MNTVLSEISLQGLVVAFLPVAVVVAIMFRWSAGAQTALYATFRMLVQLLLIGYVLVYIFDSNQPVFILAVLAIMLTAASWIAIRPLQEKNSTTYLHSLLAISVGGIVTLALVSQMVLNVDPWFSPRYLVPLAGMIFAGSMNAVSLAAERLYAEYERGTSLLEARRISLQAALSGRTGRITRNDDGPDIVRGFADGCGEVPNCCNDYVIRRLWYIRSVVPGIGQSKFAKRGET